MQLTENMIPQALLTHLSDCRLRARRGAARGDYGRQSFEAAGALELRRRRRPRINGGLAYHRLCVATECGSWGNTTIPMDVDMKLQ